jgi:hypothetical protein
MTLNRCLPIIALALPAMAQPQITADEAETSPVMRTARIIRVQPELSQLIKLTKTQADPSKLTPLRQKILEKVVAASLQVDATIAQIDNEIAQSNEVLPLRQKGQGCQPCQYVEYRSGRNLGSDQ